MRFVLNDDCKCGKRDKVIPIVFSYLSLEYEVRVCDPCTIYFHPRDIAADIISESINRLSKGRRELGDAGALDYGIYHAYNWSAMQHRYEHSCSQCGWWAQTQKDIREHDGLRVKEAPEFIESLRPCLDGMGLPAYFVHIALSKIETKKSWHIEGETVSRRIHRKFCSADCCLLAIEHYLQIEQERLARELKREKEIRCVQEAKQTLAKFRAAMRSANHREALLLLKQESEQAASLR